MADGYKIDYIETSAKDNLNIAELFSKICEKTYQKKFASKQETSKPTQPEPVRQPGFSL